MTLEITTSNGERLDIKTHDIGKHEVELRCGSCFADVPIVDFLIAVEYVLTNVDLAPDDPRLLFIERIRASSVGAGWDKRGKRIHLGPSTQWLDALKSATPPSR